MENPFEVINRKLENIQLLIQSLGHNSETQNPSSQEKTILDTRQLSEKIDVTVVTIQRWRDRGKIPFFQVGGVIRYDLDAVLAALGKKRSKQKDNGYHHIKVRKDIPYQNILGELEDQFFDSKSVKHGFVYIILNKDNCLYKIGYSKDPVFREKTLMSQEPNIEVIFKHEANMDDESKIHKAFEKYRVRGEWFTLNLIQVDTVKKYFTSESEYLQKKVMK